MYREIYAVTALSSDMFHDSDVLLFRKYYSNKNIAEKHAKEVEQAFPTCEIDVNLVSEKERWLVENEIEDE